MSRTPALAVVGLGMASPAGLTPQDHAIFLRARLAPPPSPFVAADEDTRIAAHGAAWMAAGTRPAERMAELLGVALEGALEPLGGPAALADLELGLCLPAPRPGASEDELRDVESSVAAYARPRRIRRHRGAAGIFDALAQPPLDEAPRCLVAVDSLISLEWIAHRLAHPPSPWVSRGPPPSEGAAALVVVPAHRARQLGLASQGTVRGAATERGTSHDDNDEVVDGHAMCAAFGRLGLGRVELTFGQELVDALRRREWHMMAARFAPVFFDGCADACFESEVGLVGAAAGAMNLAYGLASLAHDTCPEPLAPGPGPAPALAAPRRARPFVAWAIGRDGVRGVASAVGP